MSIPSKESQNSQLLIDLIISQYRKKTKELLEKDLGSTHLFEMCFEATEQTGEGHNVAGEYASGCALCGEKT